MEYTKDNPLRIVTLCSGYDSQCLAMEELKRLYPPFDYELVAWSEFDPESKTPLEKQPAVLAHNSIFPQWRDRNLGDMTKVDWANHPLLKGKRVDLLFYSTPCQSINQSGRPSAWFYGGKWYAQLHYLERERCSYSAAATICHSRERISHGERKVPSHVQLMAERSGKARL